MDTEMLLTPPASAASPSPSTASGLTRASNNLPAQRRHPLIRGSAKEVHLIHYVDDALARVYRRYEKRLVEDQRSASTPSKHDDAPGYVDMSEVVADLDGLVDIVWISRTPSLQTAYLLSIAGYLCSYLPAFTFAPTIFPILTKIDQAFVALLSPSTSDPASTSARRVPTQTDRVRIKSLVDETRIAAVNAAIKSGWSADLDDSDDDQSEGEVPSDQSPEAFDDSAVNAGLGKIYKGTIEILGDSLDLDAL